MKHREINPEIATSQITRNESIQETLKEGKLPLLPFEKKLLESELENLANKQNNLSKLLGEAMSQSSETWHDNAPADSINHEARLVSDRASSIQELLFSSTIYDYPDDNETITLGSIVSVEFSPDVVDDIFISGSLRDISDRDTEFDFLSNMDIATLQSPMGKALLGKKTGEKIKINFGGNSNEIVIRDIRITQEK